MEDTIRWNIKVSKETDLALRALLGSKGIKMGGRSKFIEDAVRIQVFHHTVRDIKTRNADSDPEELQAIIDEAVRKSALRSGPKGSPQNRALECVSFWTPTFSSRLSWCLSASRRRFTLPGSIMRFHCSSLGNRSSSCEALYASRRYPRVCARKRLAA
jgi:hypothetical protein